ncbi:MAG: hypothetical protein HFI34_02300 [Lachnospiraceae bacterium]|nr:hypothetical protein [Lachnospiraceae bacterium]
MSRKKQNMRKLKIFVTFDGIVMIVSLALMYILNYIDIHDKRIYAGLSSRTFWQLPLWVTFLISLSILVFITIIIISIFIIQKMKNKKDRN